MPRSKSGRPLSHCKRTLDQCSKGSQIESSSADYSDRGHPPNSITQPRSPILQGSRPFGPEHSIQYATRDPQKGLTANTQKSKTFAIRQGKLVEPGPKSAQKMVRCRALPSIVDLSWRGLTCVEPWTTMFDCGQTSSSCQPSFANCSNHQSSLLERLRSPMPDGSAHCTRSPPHRPRARTPAPLYVQGEDGYDATSRRLLKLHGHLLGRCSGSRRSSTSFTPIGRIRRSVG